MADQKTMFIVKAKPDSLHTASTWLTGKGGWLIESSDQIKDALPRILAMKPEFVVICMDHPNQKIRMLPRLFEQALQTKVIAYIEGTSPASLAAISGMEYVLYPPITGTALDRMTAKVMRDQKRKEQTEARRAESGIGKASLGTMESGVISIKGSAQKNEDAFTAIEQAKSALLSMAAQGDVKVAPSGAGSTENLNSFFGAQESTEFPTFGGAGKQVNANTRQEKKPGSIPGLLKKARTLFSRTDEKKGYTETSGLVLGAQKAIDELAEEMSNAEILPLVKTTQAICFFVMSKNHQGIVLCSIAHNTEPLFRFVDMFKTRLTELMTDLDKNFMTSGALEVTLQQVEFDGWVQSQAAFSKKFVHLDRECGVAFFELAPPRPDVSPSNKKDFVQMRTLDVTQDRKLGFNMYLYLPVNKKFILYTRENGIFARAQKQRLLERGVSDVHLYESEVDKMHRTHLEAYLDERITEHYETRDKKPTVSN